MRLINNILYIGYTELVKCGVSELTIRSAKSKKVKSWVFIEDPDDNRRVLVEYEKLGNSYKALLKKRYGDVDDFIASQPIRNLVKWDGKAEQFYLNYRTEDSKPLAIEYVQKYTAAANWLNMLRDVLKDKKALKTLLKLDIIQLYNRVMRLFETDNIDLPTSYRRLLEKQKNYEKNGYACLIDWRIGGVSPNAKIKDNLSEAILLEMIAHHNQFDGVFIAQQYNKWAEQSGYKTISSSTVGNHRRGKEHEIIMEREGNEALNEKYLPQIKGFRPTHPLAMIESDDNHIDLQFIDLETNNYYARYKAVVIIDSFNDYVLGYAYSTEAVTIELVKAAYINAMYYIKSITNAWHLPHETKTDQFGIATLQPFYQQIGNYVKAPVGSKHRGYIEPFFGSSHWKTCLKLGAINYTGNNITTANAGVNREFVNKNIKNRPLIGNESISQVEQFFHNLRHLPTSKGVSKHNEWLEAWNNLDVSKKRPITDEQFLLKFGINHNYRGDGIRITNRGVEPQINGVRYSYDLEQYDLQHIGKSVSLLYDPFDMSRILITDFDKVRILGYEARLQSRSLTDGEVDSRKYLNILLEQKKDAVKSISKKSAKRKEIIQDHFEDAEAILVSGVMVKEIKQHSEEVMMKQIMQNNSSSEFNPFDQI